MTHRKIEIAWAKSQLKFFANLKNPSPRTRQSVDFYTKLLQRYLKEEEKEMGI